MQTQHFRPNLTITAVNYPSSQCKLRTTPINSTCTCLSRCQTICDTVSAASLCASILTAAGAHGDTAADDVDDDDDDVADADVHVDVDADVDVEC